MRRFLAALVTLAALSCFADGDLYIDLTYFKANPATNRWTTLQWMNPVLGNLYNYTSTAAGGFWVSNATVGDIVGTVKQKGTASEIRFQVTIGDDDTGTLYASNITSVLGIQTYPSTARSSYSIAAANNRFARIGSGGLAFTPQLGSLNLSNWSTLDTNVLGSLGSTLSYTNPETLFVATNGNDTTAVRGKFDKPWRTVYAANTNATPGDVIKIGVGVFYMHGTRDLIPDNISPQYSPAMWIKTNITLAGSGRGNTILRYQTNGAPSVDSVFVVSDGVTIRDLTIDSGNVTNNNNTAVPVYLAVDSTNVLFENLDINGGIDAFGGPATVYAKAINCNFHSWYDGVLTGSGMFELYNCNVVCETNAANTAYGASYPRWRGVAPITAGTLKMYGGSVRIINGGVDSFCIGDGAIASGVYTETTSTVGKTNWHYANAFVFGHPTEHAKTTNTVFYGDATNAPPAADGFMYTAANGTRYWKPVSWTNLANIPAGFADGTDDGAGGTTYTNNTGRPGLIVGSGIGTNLNGLISSEAGGTGTNTIFWGIATADAVSVRAPATAIDYGISFYHGGTNQAGISSVPGDGFYLLNYGSDNYIKLLTAPNAGFSWTGPATGSGSGLTSIPASAMAGGSQGQVVTWHGSGAVWSNPPAGGSTFTLTMNPNQFAQSGGTTNIKSGATMTNINQWGNFVLRSEDASNDITVTNHSQKLKIDSTANPFASATEIGEDIKARTFYGVSNNITGGISAGQLNVSGNVDVAGDVYPRGFTNATIMANSGGKLVAVTNALNASKLDGTNVIVDPSGFNGNLSTTDTNLQQIAQKVDDLTSSGINPPIVTVLNQVLNSGGAARYWSPGSTSFSITSPEAAVSIPFPKGTYSNFWFRASGNIGAGTNITFTWYTNGTAGPSASVVGTGSARNFLTTLSLTIATNGTPTSILVSSDSAVAVNNFVVCEKVSN